MPSLLQRLLRHHRQAVRAEWSRRLRIQQASTALANPEVLAHLMDPTLDRLGSLLAARSTSRWLALHPARRGEFDGLCRCGLNPLLAYFATGAMALDDALAGPANLSEDEREKLRLAWQILAQREIDLLCATCRRICAPSLTFPLVDA